MVKINKSHVRAEGKQAHWMKLSVVVVFCLHVSHSLSQVIYRAIITVRGCLSIPLCCTLFWVHTAFTFTHTLGGLTFINVYDKFMVDCRKNMMCIRLFFLIFFHITEGYFVFFLYGSSFIHTSAELSHTCLCFWIARKSLIHEHLFSYTSQNPVGPPLPLPCIVLESSPTILHGMNPALKWSAEFSLSAFPCNPLYFNLWHWNTLSFLSYGKLATCA